MIAPDGELPDDEAIGVASGWWPSFGNQSGAYVKLNGDGSGRSSPARRRTAAVR